MVETNIKVPQKIHDAMIFGKKTTTYMWQHVFGNVDKSSIHEFV